MKAPKTPRAKTHPTTARRQPLDAKSVFITRPELLAALSTTGHPKKAGAAELERDKTAPAGEGALDLEQIITLLIKELGQCKAELLALASREG
jgi:hypothetical protein